MISHTCNWYFAGSRAA